MNNTVHNFLVIYFIKYFPPSLDWLLCLLQYQPWSVQAGVFYIYCAAGWHESTSQSQGNTEGICCDLDNRLDYFKWLHDFYFFSLS